MSRVTMIQHINIQISNRERTREWYEKVLGAEFLDRGPELNSRQLQLRIGSGEIHTTHTPSIHVKRDNSVSVQYAEELNSITISATHQSTDRRHGIVGQKSSHFQRDS